MNDTGGDVPALPAASVSVAVTVWRPCAAVNVSHERMHPKPPHAPVPAAAPSIRNAALAGLMPMLSLPPATSRVLPLTSSSLLGSATNAVGGVLSTVIAIGGDPAVWPAALRARQVSW